MSGTGDDVLASSPEGPCVLSSEELNHNLQRTPEYQAELPASLVDLAGVEDPNNPQDNPNFKPMEELQREVHAQS